MGALKIKVGGQYVTIRRGPRGPSGAISGEMKMWPSDTLPAEGGYDWCRGAEVSRPIAQGGTTDTYKAVWDVIGTSWGAGNGTTTFNLPDMRLRVPVGAGTGRAIASTDGLAEESRNARWSHSHAHTASSPVSGGISGAYTGVYTTATNTDHNHTGPPDHATSANTPTSGGATRVTTPGHGSTGLSAQASGQSHSHGVGDPGHSHGHSITVTTTVNSADSGDHPSAAVNYIIKL